MKTIHKNETERYFLSQLNYDHKLDPHPTYTQALCDLQHRSIIATVADYAAGQRLSVLDIGCGPGDFSNWLDSVIDSYIGIEPSETELKRFCLKEKRFLIRGVGEHLEFIKNDTIDVVLLVSVLDHCINWKQTINNCWRVLKPGGLLVISMESVHNLLLRLKNRLGCSIKHDLHAHFLGLPEILEDIRNNFAITIQSTFGYGFGFDRLTRRLPIPKWVFSNLYFPLIDRALMRIFPNGGQHLLCAAVKTVPDSVHGKQDSKGGFCCPRCNDSLVWGVPECPGCGLLIPFTGSIFDSIELGKEMGLNLIGS